MKLPLEIPDFSPPVREWLDALEKIETRIKNANSAQSVCLNKIGCGKESLVIHTMRENAMNLLIAIDDLEKHWATREAALEAGKKQLTLF